MQSSVSIGIPYVTAYTDKKSSDREEINSGYCVNKVKEVSFSDTQLMSKTLKKSS